MLKVLQLWRLQRCANYSQCCFSRKLHYLAEDLISPESTLTHRLFYYMDNKSDQTVKQTDTDEKVILDLLKRQNLKEINKYDTQTLLSALTSLAKSHTIINKVAILALVNTLDSESCQRLNNLTNKEVLAYLSLFMKFIPDKITKTNFYKLAIKHLVYSSDLKDNNLVQLVFFIGLMKKNKGAQQMLRKCMKHFDTEFINNLSTEEICVICNSTFKTSTKINNKVFLDKILNYLNNNLYLFKDPAIFITMLKSIRHNRYQNDDLLTTITFTIFFNKTLQYYSFPALCHILALYSDYFFYDENLLKTTTVRCLELLKGAQYISKNTYLLQQPRLKDIKRLLWCLSNLNFKHLDKCDIETVILPQVMIRIEAGEGNNNLISLIEICLYLWMMDFRPYDLIKYCFSKENLKDITSDEIRHKAQLNLLTSCIFLEDRELYKTLNISPFQQDYNMNYQLEKRPLLNKIMENLKEIAREHEINKFELNCQIPGLNIIGITGYKRNIYKAVHIELLDEYTTMKNVENIPTGLMQLKLRLLEKYDEALIVINCEEINESSNEQALQDILLDEINFVC